MKVKASERSPRSLSPGTLLTSMALILALAIAGFAQTRHPNANAPGLVTAAKNVGPASASAPMNVTLWLKLHNQSALDNLVKQINNPNSPQYKHWLSPEFVKANFAATRKEAQVVSDFLTRSGFKVTAIDDHNMYVRAQGTVAAAQQAFQVQINRFQLGKANYFSNTAKPTISGPAGALVAHVDGLNNYGYQPHSVRPINHETGEAYQPMPISGPSPNGLFFASQCFRKPEVQKFTTNGQLPTAVYFGNRYGADITNNQPPNLPPCGYGPADLYKAYKLNPVLNAGLNGTGQSIVIVDAFGSPTIQQDIAAFTQIYGLPAANLNIIYPLGPPTQQDPGWASETTLDVEYAHTVAPNATINLVIAPDNSFDSLDASVLYAINNGLGNVISNSYGAPEALLPTALLDQVNSLLEYGASQGVNIDYSSGDFGDYSTVLGLVTVSFPSSSPFATSIGGTSMAVRQNSTMEFQTGWGNNETRIANRISEGSTPVVPPLNLGFAFGAGGGPSGYFAKPAYQVGLPGTTRQQPDISYLADPFTGVEIIQTINGQLTVSVIGGTSLACPMFSALWAVADQKNGGPLGQAAPLVYNVPPSAIDDVVPVGSPFDVFGTIFTSSGPTFYSPQQLAAPLGNTTVFYSAMYNSPFSTRWFVLTFGTDTSLTTSFGWDNVTGVGTPSGLPFLNAVSHAH